METKSKYNKSADGKIIYLIPTFTLVFDRLDPKELELIFKGEGIIGEPNLRLIKPDQEE